MALQFADHDGMAFWAKVVGKPFGKVLPGKPTATTTPRLPPHY